VKFSKLIFRKTLAPCPRTIRHRSAAERPHFRAGGGGPTGRFRAAFLGVAVGAPAPEGGESGPEGILIKLFPAEPVLEGDTGLGKKAGIEKTLGGDAGPVTSAAERFGDGIDEADLNRAPGVAEALCGFLNGLSVSGLERPAGRQLIENLPPGDDLLEIPAVGSADVHVLDKPQRDAGLAALPGLWEDLIPVDGALQDREPPPVCGCALRSHPPEGVGPRQIKYGTGNVLQRISKRLKGEGTRSSHLPAENLRYWNHRSF